MQNKTPRVSIGLPVFDGQDFVAEAIDSVLAQTFTDFELIISDNGSTDETSRICQSYAEKDARVHYYRSSQNRGASWNYNRTVELARGSYFRWLAHDDLLDPTLIAKSVAVLDAHPEVVLCFSWVVDIDEDQNVIEVKQSDTMSYVPQPSRRFYTLSELRPSHNCEEVFGLIRLDVLKQTKLIANYVDSDRTLLAELGLHGPFYEIPEPLFLHRLHNDSSVVANPTRQERTLWFDPDAKTRLVFPHWRQLGELTAVIRRGPISFGERLRCYRYMLTWLKRGRVRLWGDITWAVKHIA